MKPELGVGLGLRPAHYDHVLSRRPAVSWFEVISENYVGLRGGSSGGRPLEVLEKVRRDYPVMLHGVSLSIGSADALNPDYLKRLKRLIRIVEPVIVSDHLCWTGVGGWNLHDLLPLPYTEAVIDHVATRLRKVQEFLGRRILVENVSSYLTYRHSEMTEWEFLTEIASRADCGILLDINNIHVSAVNHGFNALDYINAIPVKRVGQMHLAGYSDEGGFLIDTHDHPVSDPVWELYGAAIRRFGRVPTLIEWDDNIPPFERLQQEAARAAEVRDAAVAA
ncbi:MAG: hypothetical protein COV48_16780 [Elusimicrobia bacterium CG11_big_fil_rev_8_21_14_0_20_64_6]|nr:MAG: hypothetical protein COV48_16780 [Elusimicrobia bacterium CG11_big_fil_rev_8_21_14_0_20_64_6]